MQTKFEDPAMVLCVSSKEIAVMPSYLSPQGLRANASVYTDVLDAVVRTMYYCCSTSQAMSVPTGEISIAYTPHHTIMAGEQFSQPRPSQHVL